MFLKNAIFLVEPSRQCCQTWVTTFFFPSHLVTGWFKGYCFWLDSNIVLSPARGWRHMGVLEEGENQEAFPYLTAFLVIIYPWQSSVLGSPPCSLSTEMGPVLCWLQGHQHTYGGQGQWQSHLPLFTWCKTSSSHMGNSMCHIFHDFWIANESEFIQKLLETTGVWSYLVSPGLM